MLTITRPDVAADVPIDTPARPLVDGTADDASLLALAPRVGRR